VQSRSSRRSTQRCRASPASPSSGPTRRTPTRSSSVT
jgi:hypothetical protein